jgi:hypothetical protein
MMAARKARLTVCAAVALAAVMVFTSLFSCAEAYAAGGNIDASPNVKYHTQAEIVAYAKAHPFSTTAPVTYATKPKTTAPYAPGALSQKSLNEGLNALNLMRYIAGVDEVTLKDEYNEYAQAAALVNAVNGGIITHYPSKPAGMSDTLYQLGREGAAFSCLGMGISCLGNVLYYFMEDSDASNIARVGHRLSLLDRNMESTGFGAVDDTLAEYNVLAIYGADEGRSSKYSGMTWPAQNMPVEHFRKNSAWSYSLYDKVDGNIVQSTIKVVLTRTRADGKKAWTFSGKSAEGYLNVADRYKTVIFRPDGFSTDDNSDVYLPGDKFDVTITGKTDESVPFSASYTVSFFSITGKTAADFRKESTVTAPASVKKPQGASLALKAKTNSDGKLTYSSKNKNIATVTENGKVTAKKPGKAVITVTSAATALYKSASKKVTVYVTPKKVTIKNPAAKKKVITAKWKADSNTSGYQVYIAKNKTFKSATKRVAQGGKKSSLSVKMKKGTYYVKVRAYKTIDGKKYYGAWSAVKKVKIK